MDELVHSTFTLERLFSAPIGRVYAAWSDPVARSRWMAQGASHTQDFVVGGHEVTSGPGSDGSPLSHRATYQDIVAEERIVTTSTLHNGSDLSTVSVTSIEFHAEGDSTRVVHTEHGVYLPGQERPEWREQGTAQQLDTLAAEFTTSEQHKEN